MYSLFASEGECKA